MLDSLLTILIDGIKENTNLGYFFFTIFLAEFIKIGTNFNVDLKLHSFKFDKNEKLKFKGRTLTLLVGLFLGLGYYHNLKTSGENMNKIVSQLSVTYLIIGVFYDFIYNLLISKTRAILGNLSKSNISVDSSNGSVQVHVEAPATPETPEKVEKNSTESYDDYVEGK